MDIPQLPIERRLNGNDLILIAIAHERGVVHFGRIDNALRRQQVNGVKMLFDACKGLCNLRAKLPFNPLTAAQTIAMLTAVSTFVFAHQGTGLFCNLTHVLGTIAAHVQDGPDMQSANRRMGVPSTLGAMAFENLSQLVRVFGQVHQWHSAVFNEAHRFAIALQAHHDVEACFAHFP